MGLGSIELLALKEEEFAQMIVLWAHVSFHNDAREFTLERCRGPSTLSSGRFINSFLSDHRKRKQAENEDNGNLLGSFVRTIPEMVDIGLHSEEASMGLQRTPRENRTGKSLLETKINSQDKIMMSYNICPPNQGARGMCRIGAAQERGFRICAKFCM
ncbi:hypothetical protein Tco_0854957, partial [Tanacetum coccineum]